MPHSCVYFVDCGSVSISHLQNAPFFASHSCNMTLQSKGRVGAIERSIVGGRLRGVERCVRRTAGVPFMCTAHVVLLMIRSILAGSHRPVSTGCLLASLIGSSGQVLLWFGVVAIRFVEIYSKCLQYYIILSVISVFVFFFRGRVCCTYPDILEKRLSRYD